MNISILVIRKWFYARRISRLNSALGIPADYARQRGLPLQLEARKLEPVGKDIYQREQSLITGAADAWRELHRSALADGIELQLVSAYRSVNYQEGILRKKLERGLPMEEILRVSAAPGYSEHHSGRAVDLTTSGFPVLEEEFELSEAFGWLTRHANTFDFHMSYPRDNPHQVAYEPWHWAWRG